MKKSSLIPFPYSTLYSFFVCVFYFFIVLTVFPYVASRIALALNPNLLFLPAIYQFLIYGVGSLCIYFFSSKLLLNERHFDIKKAIKTISLCIISLYLLNMLFMIIYQGIGLYETSNNQSSLQFIAQQDPIFFLGMVVILAPFIEEIIFRGFIYRTCKKYMNTSLAMLFSCFLFGFLHVSASLYTTDFIDLLYIFLYAGLGFVFTIAYEYNKSIHVSIYLHIIYNLLSALPMLFI